MSDKTFLPKDTRFWTKCVLLTLTATVVLAPAGIAVALFERDMLYSIEPYITEPWRLDLETLFMGRLLHPIERRAYIRLVQIGVALLTILSICMWLHRAGANARAMAGKPLEVSPGWAVGWYFIPIANLWKPYRALREIWCVTAELNRQEDCGDDSLLRAWWVLWIATNMVGSAALFSDLSDPVGNMLLTNTLVLTLTAMFVPLGVVFFVIVRRLTALQNRRLCALQ